MTKQQQATTGRICSKCGEAEVIPIVYGMPTYEAFHRSQTGEFALGGCVVSDGDPRWLCPKCHERFHDIPNENEPA